MPRSWKAVTEAVATGAGVKKGSEAALEVAAGWIQETRDLGLQLTELLHQPVSAKLSRSEREDPNVFMNVCTRSTQQRAEAGNRVPDP